jgi:hypothetical protein
MLRTVAVESVQRGVPADRDGITEPVLDVLHRCPETLEAHGHDTSLPRAGEDAAGLSPRGPHRGSGRRWS